MNATAADDVAAQIAAAVVAGIGDVPVILGGSRAIGTAASTSDYDVAIVVSSVDVVRTLSTVRAIEHRLSHDLGARVALNPLPTARFRRFDRSLYAWKLHREGVLLSAPTGFAMAEPGAPPRSQTVLSSYALSAVRYLTDDLAPEMVQNEPVDADVRRGVAKAVLHYSQLLLIDKGRYESTMAGVLRVLPASEREVIEQMSSATDRWRTWFLVRDLLLPIACLPDESVTKSLGLNAQYVALKTVRSRRTGIRPIFCVPSVRYRLARSAGLVAGAVQREGSVNAEAVELVRAILRPVDSSPTTWSDMRDVIKREWPNAHPLAAL